MFNVIEVQSLLCIKTGLLQMRERRLQEESPHEGYTQRKKRQNALREWIVEWYRTESGRSKLAYHVVLATHDEISLKQARDLLRKWDARMNRAIVGPDWKSRVQQHSRWLAFPEGGKSDPHWHLLLCLSPDLSRRRRRIVQDASSEFLKPLDGLAAIVDDAWAKTHSRGTSKTILIYSIEDLSKYLTKAQYYESLYENFVIWSEFKHDG